MNPLCLNHSAVALTKTFASSSKPQTPPSLPKGTPRSPMNASMAPSAASFAALGRLSPIAQWFQSAAAPTGPGGIPLAQIRQNLAGIPVQSDARELGPKPNFIALNEIASANTPAKRAAFAELKTAQAKLAAAEAKALTNEQMVETRRNAVDGLDTQIGDRSMRLAAGRERVKELEAELLRTTDPDDRRALNTDLREARTDLRNVEIELSGMRTRLLAANTSLSRSERALATSKTGVEAAQRGLGAASAKFSKWVKDNGLSHNRELRTLNEQLRGAERNLARARARGANATTLQGLENQVEFLGQQRLGKVNELNARIEAFEPLVDIRQNHHTITVDGDRVRLHDNVATYATDTPEGLEGRSDNDGQAVVAARLAASGLSADKQQILGIVSGHEGSFSTINTWDRAKVTAGFLQWTLGEAGSGSLVGLMKEIERRDPAAYRERFQRYGLDVGGREIELTRPDGSVLRGSDAAEAIQRDPRLAAVLSRAGTDPRIQDVQVAHGASTKIDAVRAMRVSAGGQTIPMGQILSSEYGVGLMTDRAVHGGEGSVRDTVTAALARFMQANPQANLSNPAWAARAEAQVVAALEAVDRPRARSFHALSRAHGSFNP